MHETVDSLPQPFIALCQFSANILAHKPQGIGELQPYLGLLNRTVGHSQVSAKLSRTVYPPIALCYQRANAFRTSQYLRPGAKALTIGKTLPLPMHLQGKLKAFPVHLQIMIALDGHLSCSPTSSWITNYRDFEPSDFPPLSSVLRYPTPVAAASVKGLSPVEFSAQAHWTSELLRFL